VLSHWFLDLIVHQPDLPLYPDGLKLGLGLWNHPMVELAVELVLVIAGFIYYLKQSPELSTARRIGLAVLCLVIVAIQLAGDFGPPPQSVKFMAVVGFVLYALFTVAAYFIEGPRSRSPT